MGGTLQIGRRAMRVLVVDDEPPIRSMIGMALAAEGVSVYTAANGQEALDQVAANSLAFDVIILDLTMPVMDGRTFYRELHQLTNPPPVLILSAFGATEARHELGAALAMEKPFDPALLVQRVLQLGAQ